MSKEMTAFGKKRPAYGIDLGTTNSAIAIVARGSMPEVLPLEGGKITMPSCVQWKGKEGEFVVGREAYRNRYKSSAVYSVKRLMGSDEKVTLRYGRRELEMTPAEVSAEILKALVKQASVQYKDIKDVVITVPAYFNNKQVEDTLKAAELADLNALSILREPTAASLVYDDPSLQQQDQTILVYDLGGGTFDVSVVRVSVPQQSDDEFNALYGIEEPKEGASEEQGKVYTVLATDGNAALGGDDIDQELLKILLRRLREAGHNPEEMPKEYRENLLLRLEEHKKNGAQSYSMSISYKSKKGVSVKENIPLSLKDFEDATRVIFNRTRGYVDSVLKQVESGIISSICTVGGSTKSEILRKLLQEAFKGVKVNTALNPDESIALGAAIKAKEMQYGDRSVSVFDVIPQAIGVEADGSIKTVIKRNRMVPAVETRTFSTSFDNQDTLQVNVYQGVSALVEESTYLGTLVLADLPPRPAGTLPVVVELSIDSNGLLSCSVNVEGKRAKAELTNLFGSVAAVAKDFSREDRRALKWRKFASTLDEKGQAEVEDIVTQYSAGDVTAEEVAVVIRKYSRAKATAHQVVEVDDTRYFEGE